MATATIRSLINSPELREHRSHIAQRHIWKHHTYTHRVDQIARDLSLPTKTFQPLEVSALISTNRPEQLEHALIQMRKQRGVRLETLVLTHGFELTKTAMNKYEERFGPIVWTSQPETTSLGDCYNHLIHLANGDVVAKIDDDDLYGPHYLFDQLAALDYSGAGVVGKASSYAYLQKSNCTVLRFPKSELKYHHFVSGPTIVTYKNLAQEYPFSNLSKGEDTEFLKQIRTAGISIFSTDRFGFLYIRKAVNNTHTWNISDTEILASSRVVAYGRIDEHILI